jgi:hypothetical protein
VSKRNKGKKHGSLKGMWKRIKRIRTHTPGGALRPVGCPQCGDERYNDLCRQCKVVLERAEERARREGR